ncbi:uncharacterized protein LOC120458912 isoform X1 [Drosophila santomea]|uniref:uncharacterized protein LOC120458912 isoform X1 n=1 Tax=Drosophila santomea TaxID=129105 RepID=UPI001953DD0A|nr:uncharacterized protein LOC120458912 isoform X1 [Drosophila santomea]
MNMKTDILALCILATTILCTRTRHVAGFLTAQTSANGVAGGANGANVGDHQGVATAPQRLHLPILGVGGGPVRQGPSSVGDVLEVQERAVYDPGDELLRAQELGLAVVPAGSDYADAVYNELELASKFEVLKKMEEDLRAEQELVDKSALLMKMLEDPSLETLPLVYVEEEEPEVVIPSAGAEDYADLENAVQDLVLGQSKPKRSRYYRRYPWKRHNKNRGSYMNSINSNYEPELRYACTPSKEDIFKLLVNLHENRKGNHSKTVNFCNRKRPAKAVFTNIRFLG